MHFFRLPIWIVLRKLKFLSMLLFCLRLEQTWLMSQDIQHACIFSAPLSLMGSWEEIQQAQCRDKWKPWGTATNSHSAAVFQFVPSQKKLLLLFLVFKESCRICLTKQIAPNCWYQNDKLHHMGCTFRHTLWWSKTALIYKLLYFSLFILDNFIRKLNLCFFFPILPLNHSLIFFFPIPYLILPLFQQHASCLVQDFEAVRWDTIRLGLDRLQ